MYLIGNKVDRLYTGLDTLLLGHSDLKKNGALGYPVQIRTAGFLTWFSILNPFHRHLFAQFINHYNEKYFSCFVFGKINIKNVKKAESSCMSVDPWALTICMKIWSNFFVKWYWCFFHTENRKGMKPDTYNPNKRKFCSFWYQEEKGNTSDPESVTFFPKSYHQDERSPSNSPQNYRTFQTNGERSLFSLWDRRSSYPFRQTRLKDSIKWDRVLFSQWDHTLIQFYMASLKSSVYL